MTNQLNILILTLANSRNKIAINCDFMPRFVQQDNGYTKVVTVFGAGEVISEVTESFDQIVRSLELLKGAE